jgi:S1-C subfamily serine protease
VGFSLSAASIVLAVGVLLMEGCRRPADRETEADTPAGTQGLAEGEGKAPESAPEADPRDLASPRKEAPQEPPKSGAEPNPKAPARSAPAKEEAISKRKPPAAADGEAGLRPITPRANLDEEEKTAIAIFRRNSPSVVHITTLVTAAMDFFGMDVQQIPEGSGSGFVWDGEGHIVTNFHVIQGADAAQVTLADRSTWKARLVGAYPDGDLAVLAIDGDKDRLQPVLLGTSHDLQVGQKVFAILCSV